MNGGPWLIACLGLCACARVAPPPGRPATPPAMLAVDDPHAARDREAMVVQQIEARGITNAAVLAALRAVPRHLFIPAPLRPTIPCRLATARPYRNPTLSPP